MARKDSKSIKVLETKNSIFVNAERLILEKSFHSVGIQDIQISAGLAKGSFYNHFKSKEDFGVQIIERHVQEMDRSLSCLAVEDGRVAKVRLIAFIEQKIFFREESATRLSCLTAKLSAEIVTMSEPMRTAIDNGSRYFIDQLSKLIVQGQKDGSFSITLDAKNTGLLIHTLILGTLIQGAVLKSSEPLDMLLRLIEGL